ncbi:azurin [Neisseria dentiae]|uniref:Azurin n=1 Tax=Neisseria dentiae TaxID=194197 RepID=A0A1X3DG03_9NEIS|nr:azurin [Neisseria dentiae]OSI18879.1 azurin [Neisseria dentiae]QMT46127.1 azurin [Neisseria dentiae]STZ52196.1 outer membrane protein [Neisseria dentiae]
MKIYLALISAAALTLSACSQEPAAPAASAPAGSAASAEASAASSPAASDAAPAAASSADTACQTVIEAGDDMKYNKTEINISKSCKEYTITLKHMGTMPKAAMGHDLVIAKSEDVDGVAKDGATAGAENDFIKAGDERIIAHTKLIGGGEEVTVKVDTGKFSAGNKYEFFCTFPGHLAMMRGTVNLVD